MNPTTNPARPARGLQMPMQSAPIARHGVGASARDNAGVEADGFLDDLGGIVKTVAPIAGPILGALGI